MSKIEILQFGTTGQLGCELLRAADPARINLRAISTQQADFRRPGEVVRAVDAMPRLDVVINAAAYTAVDKAETDRANARLVNATSVGWLAQACARRGAWLIHVSTDYVFDGDKPDPYREDDETNPLNVYGATKLAGEKAVRASGVKHVILRTSWVYSAFGRNFVKTMLKLGGEREHLSIVTGQIGSPTSASDIARTILDIAGGIRDARDDQLGTFHYAGVGSTSWYEFARTIFDQAADWGRIRAQASPVPARDYPTPARRPHNSRLDCGKIERAYGIKLVPWQEALAQTLSVLREERSVAPGCEAISD